MSTFFLDPAMSAALWITVKASVLLGVAAIVQAVAVPANVRGDAPPGVDACHRRRAPASDPVARAAGVGGGDSHGGDGRRGRRRRRWMRVDEASSPGTSVVAFAAGAESAPSRPAASSPLRRRRCRGQRLVAGRDCRRVRSRRARHADSPGDATVERPAARARGDRRAGPGMDAAVDGVRRAAWASIVRSACFEAASAACRWPSARAGRQS